MEVHQLQPYPVWIVEVELVFAVQADLGGGVVAAVRAGRLRPEPQRRPGTETSPMEKWSITPRRLCVMSAGMPGAGAGAQHVLQPIVAVGNLLAYPVDLRRLSFHPTSRGGSRAGRGRTCPQAARPCTMEPTWMMWWPMALGARRACGVRGRLDELHLVAFRIEHLEPAAAAGAVLHMRRRLPALGGQDICACPRRCRYSRPTWSRRLTPASAGSGRTSINCVELRA